MLRFVILFAVLTLTSSQLFFPPQPGTCTVPTYYQSFYHAPARSVPVPVVDASLKQQFLRLFNRDLTENDRASEAASVQPSPIPASAVAQINALVGQNEFFYSFSPVHLEAVGRLQNIFLNETTAAGLLRIARESLILRQFNPRVWYYALLGTILMRPDLNGYYLAWALDATPDLYVPWTIIQKAINSTAPARQANLVNQCENAQGISIAETRLPVTESPSPAVVQLSTPQSVISSATTIETTTLTTTTTAATTIPPTTTTTEATTIPPTTTTAAVTSPTITTVAPTTIPPTTTTAAVTPSTTTTAAPTTIPPTTTTATVTTIGISDASEDQENLIRKKRQTTSQQCFHFSGVNGTTSDIENRLWYFREDMQLNQHHWYWHQYFPQTAVRHADRRGEVFYFAHHNIIARYNAERIANGLQRESPLDLRLNGNIGLGYNSDLVDTQSGKLWTPRPDNITLGDIRHGADPDFQLEESMSNITNLYSTLFSHISQGFLLANRSLEPSQSPVIFRLNIRNQAGLNDLGNTVEAGDVTISTHPNFYHPYGVHNLGHIAIALSTDSDFRCKLPPGVLSDLTVAPKDLAFYKIHTLVDDLFDHYKSTLPPYHVSGGEWPLQWSGVQIQSVEVVQSEEVNQLNTFWEVTSFPLEQGIDRNIHLGDVNAQVCHQHLNHDPFTIRIVVDVNSCVQSRSSQGTMRLFMAPRHDAAGIRFTMREERRMMFLLDVFPVELRQGRNIITRNSTDSSLTRPWTRPLSEMLRDPENGGKAEYCGCGWPQHLYIPRGTEKGMEFDLFAMITNYDEDQVSNTPEDLRIQEPCNSPYIFCGVPYRKYPDARPMGYPFDRHLYSVFDGQAVRPVNSLEEYVTYVPNTKFSVVTIKHSDIVRENQR